MKKLARLNILLLLLATITSIQSHVEGRDSSRCFVIRSLNETRNERGEVRCVLGSYAYHGELQITGPAMWAHFGCTDEEYVNFKENSLAMVSRGQCTFTTKIFKSRKFHARGLVVIDNDRLQQDKHEDVVPIIAVEEDAILLLEKAAEDPKVAMKLPLSEFPILMAGPELRSYLPSSLPIPGIAGQLEIEIRQKEKMPSISSDGVSLESLVEKSALQFLGLNLTEKCPTLLQQFLQELKVASGSIVDNFIGSKLRTLHFDIADTCIRTALSSHSLGQRSTVLQYYEAHIWTHLATRHLICAANASSAQDINKCISFPHSRVFPLSTIAVNNLAVGWSLSGKVKAALELMEMLLLLESTEKGSQESSQEHSPEIEGSISIGSSVFFRHRVGLLSKASLQFNYHLLSLLPLLRFEMLDLDVCHSVHDCDDAFNREDGSLLEDEMVGRLRRSVFDCITIKLMPTTSEVSTSFPQSLSLRLQVYFLKALIDTGRGNIDVISVQSLVLLLDLRQKSLYWRDVEQNQVTLSRMLTNAIRKFQTGEFDLDSLKMLCGMLLPGLLGPEPSSAELNEIACSTKTIEAYNSLLSYHLPSKPIAERETKFCGRSNYSSLAIISPSFRRDHPAGQQLEVLLRALRAKSSNRPPIVCFAVTESKDPWGEFPFELCNEVHVLRQSLPQRQQQQQRNKNESSELHCNNISALSQFSELLLRFDVKTVFDVTGFTSSGDIYMALLRSKVHLVAWDLEIPSFIHISDRVNPFAGGMGLGASTPVSFENRRFALMDYVAGDAISSPADYHFVSSEKPFLSWLEKQRRQLLLPTEFWIGYAVEVDTHLSPNDNADPNTDTGNFVDDRYRRGIDFVHVGRVSKIDFETFRLWMAVLKAVNGRNKLHILLPPSENCTANHTVMNSSRIPNNEFSAYSNLLVEAAACGVSRDHISVLRHLPHGQHLKRLAALHRDSPVIAFDTLYFNGLTTTADLIRAGLPILTIQGAGTNHAASLISSSYHSRGASAMGPLTFGWRPISTSMPDATGDEVSGFNIGMTVVHSLKAAEDAAIQVSAAFNTRGHRIRARFKRPFAEATVESRQQQEAFAHSLALSQQVTREVDRLLANLDATKTWHVIVGGATKKIT